MPQPNPAGPLEIHPGLVLKGQLSMVQDVVLTGRFEGDLHTAGRITVAPGGVVRGSIEAGGLTLEPGNRVEARVRIVRPRNLPVKKAPAAPAPARNLWTAGLEQLRRFAFRRGK